VGAIYVDFQIFCSYQLCSFLCRPATRVLKKKKLKINVHRPVGTRVVFDDEGNTLPPLARIADAQSGKEALLLDPGMYIHFKHLSNNFAW